MSVIATFNHIAIALRNRGYAVVGKQHTYYPKGPKQEVHRVSRKRAPEPRTKSFGFLTCPFPMFTVCSVANHTSDGALTNR